MAYSTDWQFVTPLLGGQPIQTVSTTQNHPIGTTVKAVDRGTNANGEGEFVYLKGGTSLAVGSWVTYNMDDGTTVLAVANDIGPLAVSMTVADAATKYAWFQVRGKAVGLVKAAFADNGECYLTATNGSLDDADVAGDYVSNCKGASAIDAPATGMAEFEINYPFVRDGNDN